MIPFCSISAWNPASVIEFIDRREKRFDFGAGGGDAALENWKGDLNEWLQGRGKPAAEYRVAEKSGPDHALRFVMEALSAGEVLGRGEGRNKLEAERNAARDALSKLGNGG